jgi:hypothetical protein
VVLCVNFNAKLSANRATKALRQDGSCVYRFDARCTILEELGGLKFICSPMYHGRQILSLITEFQGSGKLSGLIVWLDFQSKTKKSEVRSDMDHTESAKFLEIWP